jgi:glycolate oxidase FAD binding subunit
MDYGPLLGGEAGQGTLGGALATNLSGPRRVKAGAARDHFLGVTCVTGRAETIKSGGRVVKNVTGYDMCKVLAGSWGTLAAMTDVTIKVLPKAEAEATVVVEGLDDARACAAMAAAMGSSCDVSGAAHLPDHVASYFDGLPKPQAATALRLEGFAPSVKHRKEALAALMKPFGPVTLLDEKNSRALWQSVRQVRPFATNAARQRPLWRISCPPSKGYEIAAAVTPAAQMFYDWAGGLLWVAMPFADEADAASIRAAVKGVGGHATLVRAPAAVRASVDVFEPQDTDLRALNKRVKEGFDPTGVLNPGRMWAGV